MPLLAGVLASPNDLTPAPLTPPPQDPYTDQGPPPAQTGKTKFKKDPKTQMIADLGGMPGASAEIATVQRGEFFAGMNLPWYPNLSFVVRYKSGGQNVKFYDTMLMTDADLKGLFDSLFDTILHYPVRIRPASTKPEHIEHAQFLRFAFDQIPNFGNVRRHMLSKYSHGFSVVEKIYQVVRSGDWAGSIIYGALLDKPAYYFNFGPNRELLFKNIKNPFPGTPVPPQKFVHSIWGSTSNPWGSPMCDAAYWIWYERHAAIKNRAIYMEKWASPTAVGTYPSKPGDDAMAQKTNAANIERLLTVLQSIQNDNSVAVPEGLDIKLLESMRNGSISWSAYMTDTLSMMSRLITGQVLGTSTGSSTGSYAQAIVHDRHQVDKEESIALSHGDDIRNMGIDLVTLNYGAQDRYPIVEILAKSMEDRVDEIELAQLEIETGFNPSRSFLADAAQVVEAETPEDVLPMVVTQPTFPRTLPNIAGFGEPDQRKKPVQLARARIAARRKTLMFADPGKLKVLYDKNKKTAVEKKSKLDEISSDAKSAAKPAITGVVKSIAKSVKKAPSVGGITKAQLYGSLPAITEKGGTLLDLGYAFNQMVNFAAADESGNDPTQSGKNLSTAAKIALALEVIAIIERVFQSSQDGSSRGMTPQQFANSLTDPNGHAVDGHFADNFDSVHGTDVSTVDAAKLYDQLQDPKFRQEFPYLQIVHPDPQPDSRLGHKVMDGWIVSSDIAADDPTMLPPYGFGSPMIAVPISAEDAAAAGLTGSYPVGTLEDYLTSQGATQGPYGWTMNGQNFTPGMDSGFRPATSYAHTNVTMDALRQKAYALQYEDPQGWANLVQWLVALFGFNPLTTDAPPAKEMA